MSDETNFTEIPLVMIDGNLYYNTGRESQPALSCGTMDGEINSTVSSTKVPTEDEQSNFGTGYGYQYRENDTIELYMADEEEDNYKWIIFEQKNPDDELIQFQEQWIKKSELSEETIQWLEQYNELSELEQLSRSYIPYELLEKYGAVKAQDSEAGNQEEH